MPTKNNKKSEEEKQKLNQEYRERHIRWNDRQLFQMSFYNNLLLTVGIGFLSFAYRDSIDCFLTWRGVSIIVVTLSVFTGFMASISRLYDFRLTSQINLIRQRAWERSGVKTSEKTVDNSEYSFWERTRLLCNLFLFGKYPKITLEQCKSWKKN